MLKSRANARGGGGGRREEEGERGEREAEQLTSVECSMLTSIYNVNEYLAFYLITLWQWCDMCDS